MENSKQAVGYSIKQFYVHISKRLPITIYGNFLPLAEYPHLRNNGKMERQQDPSTKQTISDAEAWRPRALFCNEEPTYCPALNYHYLESEEELNAAFDILFEEVNKLITAGK